MYLYINYKPIESQILSPNTELFVAEHIRTCAGLLSKKLVSEYTGRSNLVAVVSDGTAVLGLGNIGPEAGKPVMEGKGVLFKVFADVDVYDLCLKTSAPGPVCGS